MSLNSGQKLKKILTAFLICGTFLFVFASKNVLAVNDYNKISNGTLTSIEWNNLKNDFVNTWETIRMNGPLGINTTTPVTPVFLAVGGDITANSGLFSGSVGIGTTGPGYKLTIMGGASDTSLLGFRGSDFVLGTTGSSLAIGIGAATGNTYSKIQAATAGGSQAGNLILQPISGNVGIGTTNPTVKLVVNGGTGDSLDMLGGSINGLNSTPTNSDQAVPLGYLQNNYLSNTTASSTSYWSGAKNANIWNGDAGVGNVGIGTTNPSSSLEIKNQSSEALIVRRTGVFDSVRYSIGAVWTDITTEAGISAGTVSGDILNVNGDFLYAGKTDEYNSIYIDLGTAKSAGGSMVFQYSTGGGTWGTLSVTDGTAILTIDGAISFTPPVDWATDTVNGVAGLYWVRIGTASGAFTTEPTVYLVVPNDGSPVAEFYANGRDTMPAFMVGRKGGIGIGYNDTTSYKLRVAGTGYFGGVLTAVGMAVGGTLTGASTGAFSGAITNTLSTTGLTYVGGLILNGPAATAVIPVQNSPITRFSSQAWNGTLTKINAMDIAVIPTNNVVTSGRMVFKNTTVDGVANANELMTITSGGYVGIGTTTPGYKLDIQTGSLSVSPTGANSIIEGARLVNPSQYGPGGSGVSLKFVPSSFTDGRYAYIAGLQSGSWGQDVGLAFYTNTGTAEPTQKVIILGNGNVGIGTTTPTNRLTVNGGTGDSLDMLGGSIQGLNSTPTNSDQAVPLGYLQNNYLSNTTASSTSYWSGAKNANIWNGDAGVGNVGIGTTNPGQKLSIYGASNDGNINWDLSLRNPVHSGTVGSGSGIKFFGDTDQDSLKWAGIAGLTEVGYFNKTALAFYTSDGTSTIERFRIGSSGNITVNGILNTVGAVAFKPTTHVSVGVINFDYPSNFPTITMHDSSGNINTVINTNGNSYFKGGNVGIGTTAPYSKLSLGQTADVTNRFAVYEASNGTYFRGIGMVNPNGASPNDYGLGLWGTSGSSVPNNTNMQVYINTIGNVGIGTTTPTNRLTVNGGTGDALDMLGGSINGLNSTPTNSDQAVPLGYLQNNYLSNTTASSTSFWSGAKNGKIWNGDAGLGNVGIGTTNPWAGKLMISGANGVSNSMVLESMTAGGASVRTAFIQDATSGTLTLNLDAGSNGPSTAFAIQQSGSDVFRILANGNVGIGTTNPTDRLSVAVPTYGDPSFSVYDGYYSYNLGKGSKTSGTERLSIYKEAHVAYFDNYSTVNGTVPTYQFQIQGNTKLTINNLGNVGIGTTTPTNRLTVNGGTGDALDMLGGSINGLNSTPTNSDQAVPLGYLQNNYLSNTTASSTSFWSGAKNSNIWNGDAGVGNVGIGTTNPVAKLQVNGEIKSPKINKMIVVDGTTYTADGAGIQAAINDLPATGGEVYIPEGTYIINSQINLAAKNYVTLRGAGKATILQAAAGFVNKNILWLNTNSSYDTIENLTLDGNKANNSYTAWNYNNGILLQASYTTINNCYFINNPSSGIATQVADYNIMSNNYYSGNGQGIMVQDTNSDNNNIFGSSFINNGLSINGSTSSSNIISDNIITNGGIGIGSGAVVRGNTIYNDTSSAITVNSTVYNVIITGNTFKAVSTNWTGMLDFRGHSSVITNNNFIGTTGMAGPVLRLSGNNNLVSGNSISGASSYGIQVDDYHGAGNDNVITNNNIFSNASYGIQVDVGVSGNSISNNKFTSNGGTINNQGAGTFLMNEFNGNVGIGTTTPTNRLTVNGGTGDALDMLGGSIHGLNSTPTNTDQAVPLGYLQNNYLSNTTASSTSFWSGAKNSNIWNGDAGVGNVGIGTTNPTEKLQISGGNVLLDNNKAYRIKRADGTAISSLIIDSNDLTLYNGAHSTATNKLFQWKNSGDLALMTILGQGNVGIGTTAPGYKLDLDAGAVNNVAQFKGQDTRVILRSNSEGWRLREFYFTNPSDSQTVTIQSSGDNGNPTLDTRNYLDFQINGVSKLFLGKSGNVGIGTTAPGSKLTVSSADNSIYAAQIVNTHQFGMGLRIDTTAVTGESQNALLVDTTGSDFVIKANSGNVGIGTTTPTNRLTVNGGTGDALDMLGGSINGLNSTPTNSDQAVPLGYLQNNYLSNTTASSTSFWSGAKNSNIWNGDAGVGNVGIGTTTPGYLLDVNGRSRIKNDLIIGSATPTTWTSYNGAFDGGTNAIVFGAAGDLHLTSNAKGLGTWKYYATGNAANMYIYNGELHYRTAPSGSADANITWTDRFTIQQTGNVGIGTTSPSYALHIGGTNKALKISDAGSAQIFLGAANSSKIEHTANQFAFTTMQTQGFTFTGGNVGIGTTNPRVKLQVGGGTYGPGSNLGNNLLQVSSSAGTAYLTIGNSDGANGHSYIGGSAGNLYIGRVVDTGVTTERLKIGAGGDFNFNSGQMYIQGSTGNVGIGTTTPTNRLTVNGGTGDALDMLGGSINGLNSTPTNTDQAVPLGYLQNNYAPIGSGAGSAFVQGGNSFGAIANLGTNDAYALNLETNNSPRLTIDSAGSVGIGTTTPGYSMEVNGTFKVSTSSSSIILDSSGNILIGI